MLSRNLLHGNSRLTHTCIRSQCFPSGPTVLRKPFLNSPSLTDAPKAAGQYGGSGPRNKEGLVQGRRLSGSRARGGTKAQVSS